MQKKHLEVAYQALSETSLSLSQARIRDAILNKLKPVIEQYYQDRKKVFETFCRKDENGKPEIIDDNYKFDQSVQEELVKELNTLLNEEVDIEITDEVKEIINNTNYKPKPFEVELIDQLCKN